MPVEDVPAAEERWVPVLLAMAREVWVLRDRQRMLEDLLARHGVIAPGAVDRHQPVADVQAIIDRDCRAFVDSVIAEITGRKMD